MMDISKYRTPANQTATSTRKNVPTPAPVVSKPEPKVVETPKIVEQVETHVEEQVQEEEQVEVVTKPMESEEVERPLPEAYERPQRVPRASNTKKPKNGEFTKTAIIDYLPPEFDVLPTKARQVARPDLPVDVYGVAPAPVSYVFYNLEISEKLSSSSFSKWNIGRGGVALTPSQLVETILGFVLYDLELEPMGFTSTHDLRNYLVSRMKEE